MVDWDEAFGAVGETFEAFSVEDVRRVAAKLNDLAFLTPNAPLGRNRVRLVKVVFELVHLHLHVGEGLLAPLAKVGVVIHQVLQTADHHRVLKLTFAGRLHE